jgi:hypothetical protein
MTLENIPSLPEAFFDQNSLLTKGTLGIFCFYHNEKSPYTPPFFSIKFLLLLFCS